MATVAHLGTYYPNSPLGNISVAFFRKGNESYFTRPIIARVTAENGSISNLDSDGISLGICRVYNQNDQYGTQTTKKVEYTPFMELNEGCQNTILTDLFQNRRSLSVIGELDSYNRLHVYELIIG